MFKYTAESLREKLKGRTNPVAKEILKEIESLENLHLVSVTDEDNTLMFAEDSEPPPKPEPPEVESVRDDQDRPKKTPKLKKGKR